MLPLVRSIARIDTVVRVLVVVILSSLIIPIVPGPADARTSFFDINARFNPNEALPGQSVLAQVEISTTRFSAPVIVDLRITDERGRTVASERWNGVRLERTGLTQTLRSSFAVPPSATPGQRYNAEVSVSYSSFMLAYERRAAVLTVINADSPTPTSEPTIEPTATASQPTATPLPPTAAPTSEPTEPPSPTATETPAEPQPEPESVLRVNAGGRSFTDARGLVWWADSAYSGGSGYSIIIPIDGTDADPIYASERWGNFSYTIEVPNGSYDLRLMFAEIWFTEPGQRVFNVSVNGAPVLRHFDILAETARLSALDKIVPVAVTDGELRIVVASGSADFGKLSGFELLRLSSAPAPAPEPTATATAEPTTEPTEPPAPTPEPSPSATATSTPVPTATPSPSPEPTAEPTSTPAPTSIQEMVDLANPGDTVRVPAGTYPEKIYINKPVSLVADGTVIIDGESRDRWIVGQASDVTIDGFTFINSNQPQYHGGLSNDGHNNWTIRNNTFRDAGNAAIDIKEGSGHLIENNTVVRAGNVGIRIESVGSATVRGNDTSGNNTKNLDPGWEAGGMKITGNYGGVHNLVIENNRAHNNNGPGIWVDVDGQDIEIRNNRVHDNSRAGIIYELSFRGRIHGNVVYNNGDGFDAWGFGAGILIQNSSDVEVFNNIVAWNADGISVISQNRGESRWNNVTGNTVRDNTIIANHDGGWNTYGLAWLEDWNGVLDDAGSNNNGHGNRFWFSSPEGPELRFRWCDEGFWTLDDFNASPGGRNSQYLTDAQKDQILASAGM